MNAVLVARDLTRVYRQGRTEVAALRGVSLTVRGGELVAAMGPSGSGKSTLLALAGGLDRPTSGSVCVTGVDLAGLSATALAQLRRREIGYVFQDRNLLPQLTAAENVALPLELDGTSPRASRRLALGVLAEVGLTELVDRFPDDLSGGEQQRVAVARCLVGSRRLLLADEPTGSLDSLNGETIVALLRKRCDAGLSAVMVTHDAALAAWADRVVFLRDGRLVDQAGPLSDPEAMLLDGSL
jgi:putative ABC transport system ATP-binding protein